MNVPAMRIIIASASAVVFDKTGTLTYGTMDVADVLPCPGADGEWLLYAAAADGCTLTATATG